MTSDEKADLTAIAADIAGQAADSLQAGRPLFLIVYYEHEAVKTACLEKLRQTLNPRGIAPQTFDPGQRPEHGTGRLHPLLSAVAQTKSLALVTSLPPSPRGGRVRPHISGIPQSPPRPHSEKPSPFCLLSPSCRRGRLHFQRRRFEGLSAPYLPAGRAAFTTSLSRQTAQIFHCGGILKLSVFFPLVCIGYCIKR